MSDSDVLNNAVQEGTVCQYVNNIKAGVIPGTLASFATGSFNTSGDQKQLGAQLKQSSRKPFEFEAPADSSDLQHRLQRRRRANRESARRVRERRTEQCGVLEAQAVEAGIKNKRLIKKMADVQGENSLATSLLQAFHIKVAHMQGLNESLRVNIAIMEGLAGAQVGNQLQIGHVGPAPDATVSAAPPVAELLFSSPARASVCNPPPVQPQPSQARAVSPFATAAPATSLSQAAPLPVLSNQGWDANLGLDQSSQTAALPSVYTNAARADSMDAMLSVLDAEQPADRMQCLSSLTLSSGLSAILEAFPLP